MDDLKQNLTKSAKSYFEKNDGNMNLDAGQKADMFDEAM